jgi:hypothetical protein
MTKVRNSWGKNRGCSSTDLKYGHPFLQPWWSQNPNHWLEGFCPEKMHIGREDMPQA